MKGLFFLKNYKMAQFVIGNKDAEKWTEDDAKELFLSIRELCKDGKINSLQDAILKANHYHSGYYYLLKKYPVLDSIKEDSQNIIIAGVNQKALDGTFNPTASIWRMKQCGEKDESAIDHKNNGSSFETPKIVFKKFTDE